MPRTPMPPGYGYLTRHLPHRATHTWLSGSASRQASPGARNEEETRYCTQIPRCSGPDSHNEQTPALKVPLQTELRFHPRRYEQPSTLEGLRDDKTPGGSPPPAPAAATMTSTPGGQTAAAMTSGQTLLRQGPRPRPHSRGEDKLSKPKSRRPGAQMAAATSSATRTSPAATTSAPTTAATCPPAPHQRAPAAPKCTGRSPLKSSRTGGHRPPRGGVVPE